MTSGRPIKRKLEQNLSVIKKELGFGVSFDVLVREFRIGGKDAALVFIDGLVKDEVMTGVMRLLLLAKREEVVPLPLQKVVKDWLPYGEVFLLDSLDDAIDQVLSGPAVLFMDGQEQAVAIDLRQYPGRSPDEPDLERVLRGSRDGFIETIVFNAGLIRRRVRDPGLRIEIQQVGNRSKTDVGIIYIKDIANPDLVEMVKNEIAKINVDGIPMAEKSVEEYITAKKPWWNPLPVVRYTERPDVAAIHLLEGHVLVAVDTSPSIMILPATFFHHVQHAEEFRQEVVVGAYLRWVRFAGTLLAWFLPPVWVLVATRPELLPEGLRFIGPRESANVPLFLQFLFAEVGLDIIRMALIHTPNALATSLGFIGAVLLGQIAVEVGLFVSETILYIVIAALGTFSTPSMEFSLAVRLFRLSLLILVGIFSLPGFVIGLALNMLLILGTRSFGVRYTWPLVPFDWNAFLSVLVRRPVPAKNVRPLAVRPRDADRV